MTSLDTQLADAITAHHAARKRGDTRAVHYWLGRMHDLRTKQLRRDYGWRGKLRRAWAGAVEWLAPLARIAGTFACILVGAALYCLACPLDAYAAERSTKFDSLIDPTTGAIAIGLTIAILLVLGAYSMFAVNPRDPHDHHRRSGSRRRRESESQNGSPVDRSRRSRTPADAHR